MLSTYIFSPFRPLILGLFANIFRLYVYLMLPIYKRVTKEIFARADIKLNGDRPWDMKIKNDRFYLRMAHQVIGFDPRANGETYMDGDWECDRVDQWMEKFVRQKLWT